MKTQKILNIALNLVFGSKLLTYQYFRNINTVDSSGKMTEEIQFATSMLPQN